MSKRTNVLWLKAKTDWLNTKEVLQQFPHPFMKKTTVNWMNCVIEVEWVLHVVSRGWVQQIWVEFTVFRSKAIVLMGLASIIPAEGRTTRMTLPHMEEVFIRAAWCVTTILTYKYFGTSLTVGILLVDTMNLPHMRLQRTSLCEGFLTKLTLVGTDTYSRGR